MANSYTTIKDLIRFLDDVNRGKQIKRKESDFFKLTKDLDDVLDKYYISFKNNDELREQVAYNYNLIKDMSFPESKEVFFRVKDLANHTKPKYSNEQYNSYALFIHSYLMRNFKEKLGLNVEVKRKKITIKNKNIFEVLKRVNLEIDFLKEDVNVTDFIYVLTVASEKQIHLNIDNRSFHYLLSKIKEYFFNFSYTAVAETNKIYSKGGKVIKAKTLRNSKSEYPKHKDNIDRILNNFI
jgi:hypothetical protein